MIEIKIDQNTYNKIVEAMKPLEKSEESVFKTAVNNTAKKAQKRLARQAKKVYGGEAPEGILGRSGIKKATVKNTSVEIVFRSEQHNLDKFRTNISEVPIKPVWWFKTHINIPVNATQFLKSELKTINNAFAIKAKNGKKLIVARTGEGKTRGHSKKEWGYDKVKALMGSSDKVMIQNDKVYGKTSDDIGVLLQKECQKALDKVLAKGK